MVGKCDYSKSLFSAALNSAVLHSAKFFQTVLFKSELWAMQVLFFYFDSVDLLSAILYTFPHYSRNYCSDKLKFRRSILKFIGYYKIWN